jgi:RNA polymerase sigma-70 factor (ECF subfamily)
MTTHPINPENWNPAYRDYLIRFALQRVSDYGTAEDLVQDTFAAAWGSRASFRGDCSERTWLTGILRNKVIDHYRRTGRRPSVLTTDLDRNERSENDSFSWIDQQPDLRAHHQPEAETQRHEFMRDLEVAVTELPEKMALAFKMREIEGYSTEEITEILQISKANLWVLIHRAKQALSEQLGNDWMGTAQFGHPEAA